MLQEELKKRDLLLDHYKSLYIQRQDEIDELKNKAGTTEFIREKLISTRNTTNATLKRYDTKYEVQLAEMRHATHTKVSAMSYKLTLEEKESELAQLLETQNTNQELSKLLESSTTFMDGSLAEITRLQAQVKSLEADRNPDQRTKFLRKKLKDMEHQVKNLTNNVDALTVERERLIANNEALNNEIITVVEKMTRLHDLEIQALKKQL
ncbi:hypothetical protein BC941DRAFT_448132 [Chlamydoabsidia padenii]|nr:hypothetical protein BC941DRAFT_448132 [Chlamydoabsidia padenii]